MGAEHKAVLLDTDVFSALFVTPDKTARRQGHPIDEWRAALTGHRVVIAFQTRAEALVGARSANFGEPRTTELIQRLDSTPTVQIDDEVLEAFVTLTVEARAQGRGIGHHHHTADRWIAACAIAKSLPLLSRDGIFDDAPSLTLFDVTRSGLD